jgi:hypothetical protein
MRPLCLLQKSDPIRDKSAYFGELLGCFEEILDTGILSYGNTQDRLKNNALSLWFLRA